MFFISLFLFTLISLSKLQAATTNFESIITDLPSFQTSSGGFSSTPGSPIPSLSATSGALFLTSLYGLKERMSTFEDIPDYIQSLRHTDQGYKATPTAPKSDLDSIRYAVLCYKHKGALPDVLSLSNFVRQFYDEKTKLFASTLGEKGNLKATATALHIFELLGELDTPFLKELASGLKEKLNSLLKRDTSGARFVSSGLDDLEATFYGIVIGDSIKFEFGNIEDFVKFISSQQILAGSQAGGFKSKNGVVSVLNTYHAISALASLPSENNENLANRVNTELVLKFVRNIPYDLELAVLAHKTIAQTDQFRNTLTVRPSYELLNSRVGSVSDKIIQGTQLKPVLSVQAAGIPHAGLDVSVKIDHDLGTSFDTNLQFDSQNQNYDSSEFYDTKDKLGELAIHYKISSFVVDLRRRATIEFDVVEKKKVGYLMKVQSDASLGGKAIDVGDVVGIGTNFEFDVSLSTQSEHDLRSGDFSVGFSVEDSSGISIHEQEIDCRDNSEKITFSYTLDRSNIPGGDLNFVFTVKNKDGVHTESSLSYQLSIPMIATKIEFKGFGGDDKPVYKIGETVSVVISPASLPDLKTVHTYAPDNADKRKFFMDIMSSRNTILRSIQGKLVEQTRGEPLYSFDIPITATFDSIGTNLVSFRYLTKNGRSIALSRYDSVNEELADDSQKLTYTVNAELHLSDITNAPKHKNLYYGNNLKFRVAVKDYVSKQYVWASEESTLSLLLRHDSKYRNKAYVSAKQPAQVIYGNSGEPVAFEFDWDVNPNAVKGSGSLVMSADAADKSELTIYKPNEKTEWSFEVNIGGEISVDSQVHTKADTLAKKAFFLTKFDLKCQDKKLTGAKLQASVIRLNDEDSDEVIREEVAYLPVLRTSSGDYQVTYMGDIDTVKSGKYVLEFFRDVDKVRAAEKKEFIEKEKIKREARSQREGKKESTKDLDDDVKVEPLFTIDLEYKGSSYFKLPFRFELILIALYIGIVVALSFKKLQLESPKAKIF